MHKLTINQAEQPDLVFTGSSRPKAVEEFAQWADTQPNHVLNGICVTQGYRETRTLIVDNGNEWAVECEENGVGDCKGEGSRITALNFFVRCCLEKGDHWG